MNKALVSVVAMSLILLAGFSARAATRSYNCNSANNQWSVAANWVPSGIPQNGDTLVFGNLAGNRATVNDLVNLKLDAIQVLANNYQLSGNALTVTNGIVAASASLFYLNNDLTLGGSQTFDVDVNSNLRLYGDVNLNGFNLLLDNDGYMETQGAFTGTGNLTKQGSAELIMAGTANTFNGTLTINTGGQFSAAKASCFPTNVQCYGTVFFYNSDATHTNGDITMYPGARFDTGNARTNTIRNLTMQGAALDSAQLHFVLRSNLTTLAWGTPSVIKANLDLLDTGHTFNIANGGADADLQIMFGSIRGGANAGYTKLGLGKLYLGSLTTSYGGTNTIAGGILECGQSGGLGAGRTIVLDGASLQVTPGASVGSYFELHGNGVSGTNGALRGFGFCQLSGTYLIPTGASIRADGEMHLNGNIGGAGNLRIHGTNELWTHGAANTLAGGYFVESGTFVLGKANGTVAVASPILVGSNSIFATASATLRNAESNQITSTVTIAPSGTFDLNGQADTVPGVDLYGGGKILLNGGRLILAGDLRVIPNFYGSTAVIANGGYLDVGTGTRKIIVNEATVFGGGDPLELDIQTTMLTGTATILKQGDGDMRIQYDTSYSGNFYVEAGDVEVTSLSPFGGTATTYVEGPGALVMSGLAFSDTEPITFNGTGRVDSATLVIKDSTSLRGTLTLIKDTRVSVASNAVFAVRSPVVGSGGLVKEGPGEMYVEWDRTNTFSGGLEIKDGQVTLDHDNTNAAVVSTITIGDGTGAAASARLLARDVQQIGNSVDVTMLGDGRFTVTNMNEPEIIRTLNGSGQLFLYGNGLRLNDSGLNSTFNGSISGNGDLIKAGAGKFTHNGTCNVNGLLLSIFGGETTLNGTWNGSPSATYIDAYSGTILSGTGTIQDVNIRSGAVLSPGASPGILTLNNLTMVSGANLFMEVRGAIPGIGHDQIVAKSSVNISNASLTLSLNYPPAEGEVIRLVDNQGASPILGTFTGKPQGSLITEGGNQFVISYTGGTGNDITLTVANARLALAATLLPGGNGLVDAGECNELYLVLTNKSGGALSGVTASLDSRSPAIAVSQQNSAYPNFTANSSRTNTTAFRLSSLPGFQCGQLVELQLTVTISGVGSFAIPVRLTTGTLGPATAYTGPAVPIPDLATTNSTINVAGFDGRVEKVTVSFYLTHTFDADLDIYLQSPSGTLVKLVADRGGSGDNFGTNCSPSSARTTFDDSSRNSIILATAPFQGTYSPEEPLATFQGEPGNGPWKLVLTDDASGDTGTLNCWTLNLYSAVCGADSASACAPCTPEVFGGIGAGSPTMPQRIVRDANPSVCGETKLCPGASVAAGPFRYATHTFTNAGPATCVTVVLQDQCANQTLFATAYQGSAFNPGDLCANYLADIGTNALAPSMSFTVLSNGVFTVVINELIPGSSCPTYSLKLFGLACPPPTLQIAPVPAGKVRLYWNAHGSDGYNLQSAALVDGTYTNEPGAPAYLNGILTLTNAPSSPQKYFRLKKP